VAPAGHRGFWIDSHDGRRRYAQWLADGLPREVAARWPVRPGPAGRAAVGISMGGFGAFRLALERPREVGAAAALSGLVPPLDWQIVEDAHPLLRLSMRRTFGRDEHDNSLRENDLYKLLPRLYGIPPAERPRLLLRAGTEDRYILDEASYLFAMVARENGVETELVLEPGEHHWRYWSHTADDVVEWAVRALDERCARWQALGEPECRPAAATAAAPRLAPAAGPAATTGGRGRPPRTTTAGEGREE
jgi:S-formylglutathione hydrolase FrmB